MWKSAVIEPVCDSTLPDTEIAIWEEDFFKAVISYDKGTCEYRFHMFPFVNTQMVLEARNMDDAKIVATNILEEQLRYYSQILTKMKNGQNYLDNI